MTRCFWMRAVQCFASTGKQDAADGNAAPLKPRQSLTTSPTPRRPEETPNDLQIADGEIESNWDTVTDNFDDMELKPELLRGIYAYG